MISTLLYSRNYSDTQIGGEPLRGITKRVTTSKVIILAHLPGDPVFVFPCDHRESKASDCSCCINSARRGWDASQRRPWKINSRVSSIRALITGSPSTIKMASARMGLSRNRHCNWVLPRWLYFLASFCLDYGGRAAKMLTETSRVDQNRN